jgi:hypothetical protein
VCAREGSGMFEAMRRSSRSISSREHVQELQLAAWRPTDL